MIGNSSRASIKRLSILAASGLVLSGMAGVATAVPAAAADCSGLVTGTIECTVPGTPGLSRNLNVVVTGGGGGGVTYSSARGGSATEVTTVISVPGGSTIKLWVGKGGQESYGTASGGGSSAITLGSTLLVEAGGGGGASYAGSGSGGWAGGDAGLLDAAAPTPDGDDWGSGSECANDQTGGRGASGTGAGGAGGFGECDGGTSGQAGESSADGAPSAGGDGASVGSIGGGLPGGEGYSAGGDSGLEGSWYYVGSGGGGGYGGGGGGATDSSGGENGPGAGGGSYVNPLYNGNSTSQIVTSGAGYGGSSDPGADGQIFIADGEGPSVQTEAAAPSIDNTAMTATVRSIVNPGGLGQTTDDLAIRYSTSPSMSDVQNAVINPTSATGDTPTEVTGTISGLASSTTYYYQVIASVSGIYTYGEVASFTTDPAPVPPPPGPSTPKSVLSLPDQVVAGVKTPVTIRVTVDGLPVDGTAKVYHSREGRISTRMGSFVCEAQIVDGHGVCFGVFGLGKIELVSIFNGVQATGVVSNLDAAAMAAASIKAAKPKGSSVRLHGQSMKKRSNVLIYKAKKRSLPATLVKTVRSGKLHAWSATVGFGKPSSVYCAVTPEGKSRTIKVTKSGFKVLPVSKRSRGDLFFC